MKKKIDVQDLQKGMYVSDLDRPWIETPFLFQGFELRTDQEEETLRKHCQYVVIDTDLGLDYVERAGHDPAVQRMRDLAEEEEKLKAKVKSLSEYLTVERDGDQVRSVYADKVTFEEELQRAREVDEQAREVIREAFEEAQKGNKIDLELARKAVENMVDSVIRNPDAMVCLGQLKDVSEYTALHSIRSTTLALAFARHLTLDRDQMITIGLGTMLHDIGMIRVPEEVLSKPKGLSPADYAEMKKHVQWGLEIVEESGGLPKGALQIIQQHHERADGSGYPGLANAKTISDPGALAAIVDVYDAVTSDRGYEHGLSAEDTLKRMYEWRHKDFKPKFVEEFIRCMGIFPIGSLVELNTGSVGVVITINRARRLKPKVALVLTAAKSPLSHQVVTDLADQALHRGQDELKISKVLPSGSYGINPMDHIIQL